jgi:signal peptidase I
MRPGLLPGDRLLVSSIGLASRLPFTGGGAASSALKRGSIVVVIPSRSMERKKPFSALVNGFIRFFTAQRINPGDENDRMLIKRVAALPGDAVSMIDFVLRIRPAGDAYALTEFELAARPYDLTLPHLPDGWNSSVPLSGSMDQIVLASDECFLVADDRGNTNDSRTWGPTKLRSVVGKAVFRYWPPRRLGRP